MKQFLLYILLVISFAFLSSCKKEGLDTFNTTNSIFFENRNDVGTYYDTTGITFAYSNDLQKDSLIGVSVSITGSPSTQDRPFKIIADPTSTALSGIHYEKLPDNFIMPANKVKDTIWIKILRAKDLKQTGVSLFLLLQSNESFSTLFKFQGKTESGDSMSYIKYKIGFSDILESPAGWYYAYGRFTKKKMDILCMLGNVSPIWFVTGDKETPIGSPFFSAKSNLFVALLKNYLTEQNNAGTPVYYEDGTLMRVDD